MIDIYSMLPEELEEYFVSIGEPKFRAKQVFPRLNIGTPIEELTMLSKNIAKLAIADSADRVAQEALKYCK